ncbi:hypothetical protein GBA52_012884 [Prunus armeniaca]|nr:hypothetical protein GBA52_012884 [Prunus armeniaca]
MQKWWAHLAEETKTPIWKKWTFHQIHIPSMWDSSLLSAPSFGQLAGLSVPWTVLWTRPLDHMMCLRH